MPHANPTPVRIALDALGFYACLVAVLSLLLAGCGAEPAEDQAAAVREVCAVSFAADGSLSCVCSEVSK